MSTWTILAPPTTATNSLAVLAEVAQSHSSQSSLPDLIGEQKWWS